MLLQSELKQLQALEKKYEALKKASYTQESVLEKVLLLFDEALTNRLESGEETIKIFSKHISKIIAQAHKDSPEALSEVLQETIAETIASEVENNKDSMIDSLYPILGGMITKYVNQIMQEMMQTINKRVENGLSIHAYKRKIQSRVTGVSEADLLVRESTATKISSLMVIQKESGLLISEAHLESQSGYDAHMLASMASAIRDFINDWIQQNQNQDEIQTLTYGEATLYIESAGSVYIIAFLDKDPSYEMRREINTFFASLLQKYATYFRKFDGDDTRQEIADISYDLQKYIDKEKKLISPVKKKNYAKILFMSLLVFVLLYGGYKSYIAMKEYLWESKIFEKTGQVINFTYIENNIIVLKGHVSKLTHIEEIESLVLIEEDSSIKNYLLVPIKSLKKELNKRDNRLYLISENLSETFSKEHEQIRNEIKTVDKKLLIQTKKLAQIKEHISKELKQAYLEDALMRNELETAFKEHFKSRKVYKNFRLNFQHLSLFLIGKDEYSLKAIKIVKEDFEVYMKILLPYIEHIETIVIEGHSDSSGDSLKNIALSKRRALNIKKALWTTNSIHDYHLESLLSTKVVGSKRAVYINGIEDKIASRRIEVYLIFKEHRILNMLEKVMND